MYNIQLDNRSFERAQYQHDNQVPEGAIPDPDITAEELACRLAQDIFNEFRKDGVNKGLVGERLAWYVANLLKEDIADRIFEEKTK